MKYDWLLFDADHTLFDFDRSAEESLYLTLDEYGVEHDRSSFPKYHEINTRCWHEFELGRISREELTRKRFALFFEFMGISEDPIAFHRDYLGKLPQRPYLMPGAVELLNAFRDRYKLGLITNGLKEVQRPRLTNADMLKYFSVVVISGEIGHQKPDHAYFAYAYTHMGNPEKSRVLVIGDNLYADIGGALGFGFHACWYNPGQTKGPPDTVPHYEISRLDQLHAHL